MKPPRVNLSQLVTFYLVAKEGGLSRAAEKLCITQPVVTMPIKTLEGDFDAADQSEHLKPAKR